MTPKQRFDKYKEEWLRQSSLMSSVTDASMLPSYQRIIGMGEAAIPFIMEDWESGSINHWFWALTAILDVSPITPEDAGRIQKMKEVWLKYLKEKGYVAYSE